LKFTIEELWNGSIAPCEKCGCNDSEIKELICLMQRNGEKLKEDMDSKQLSVLEKMSDCFDEYVCRMTVLAFCDGFSLGCRLTSEALLDV